MRRTEMSATDSGMTVAEMERDTRAATEHVTLLGVNGDDFVFDFDGSDEAHVVHTSGCDAVLCTCPDHQYRGVRCKHMAAYEDFSLIDEFDI
jgi:hypothetical protein